MTIAQVRVLTSDLPQYDRAEATGDGQTAEFQIVQYPVIEGSYTLYVEGAAQTEPTDYSLDTEVGLVTFVAAPGNGAGIVVTYRHALLSNQQITDLLAIESNVKLAAALALDTIASSEALIQKKMRLLDVQTDGPAVAKALRDHAAELRRQVAEGDPSVASFDIAEMVFDPFTRRERIIKQAERGVL